MISKQGLFTANHGKSEPKVLGYYAEHYQISTNFRLCENYNASNLFIYYTDNIMFDKKR